MIYTWTNARHVCALGTPIAWGEAAAIIGATVLSIQTAAPLWTARAGWWAAMPAFSGRITRQDAARIGNASRLIASKELAEPPKETMLKERGRILETVAMMNLTEIACMMTGQVT
jgi:hypothetical protein